MASIQPSKANPKSRISVHFPPDEDLATTLKYTSDHFNDELDDMASNINTWLNDTDTAYSSPRPIEPRALRRDRPLSYNIMPGYVAFDRARASMMHHIPEIDPFSDARSFTATSLGDEKTNRISRFSTTPDEIDTDLFRDDGVPYPQGFRFIAIVIALCFAVFLMALDNAIVATAIPSITEEFNSIEDMGWYGAAYMLTCSSLQLLFGKFYSFCSIKWVFIVVVSLFEVGSLICAVAPTSMALIIGRAIAGMGAAGIFAGALTIMSFTVPLRKRPLFTGIVSSMWGVSAVAGPLLGGVFAEKATWRWCFYINLPIGMITIAVIVFFFKDPERKFEPKTWQQYFWQLDPIGTLCFTPAIICILLALHWGGTTYPWDSSRITSLFLVGGFATLVFLYVQFRMQDNATVPPRIFKKRSVWSASIFQFFVGAAFLTGVYFLPVWFQAVKGTSAIQSGIRSIPLLMGVVIFSIGAGAAVTKLGYYTPFMLVSGAILPVGYYLLSTLKPDSGTGSWIGFQIIVGFALGIGMQQPLIAVQVVLDMDDVPTGTSLIIFFEQLGGALFLSAGETIFSSKLATFLQEYAPEVPAAEVLDTGVTKLRDIISPESIDGIIEAYSHALQNCFWLVTGAAGATLIGALFVEWKSVKGKKLDMA